MSKCVTRVSDLVLSVDAKVVVTMSPVPDKRVPTSIVLEYATGTPTMMQCLSYAVPARPNVSGGEPLCVPLIDHKSDTVRDLCMRLARMCQALLGAPCYVAIATPAQVPQVLAVDQADVLRQCKEFVTQCRADTNS